VRAVVACSRGRDLFEQRVVRGHAIAIEHQLAVACSSCAALAPLLRGALARDGVFRQPLGVQRTRRARG
jgi:hypothetical protein